jgi:hypothetical protein
MPLEELPVNSLFRNGRPSTSTCPELDQETGEADIQNVRDSIPPSSIQSMLRLTTETGELGEFSIKPPRVPRSSTKGSFKRSDSHASTEGLSRQQRLLPPRSHRHHGPPDRRPSPANIHQNISRPRLSSQQSHSSGLSRGSAQNLTEHERLPRRIPIDSELLHHKSVGSLRNQPFRPRSPYAYPTRLRRPGYRSPSPSFSDRPNGGYRPKVSSLRTASPSSLHSHRRLPPEYYAGFNQSATSLFRSPSPILPFGPAGFNPSSLPSRTGTPLSHRVPTPLASRAPTPIQSPSPNVSFSSLHAATLHRGGSAPGSIQPPSPSPLYYDYTEGFYEDESSYSRQNFSKLSLPLSSVSHTIPEDGVFFAKRQEDIGSKLHPAELPTPTNCRSSVPQQFLGPANIAPQGFVQLQSIPSNASVPVTSPANREPLATQSASVNQKGSSSPDDQNRKPSITLTTRSSSSYHLSILSSSFRRKHDLKTLSSRVDSFSSSVLGEPVDRDSSQRVALMLPNPTVLVSDLDHPPSTWKLPSLNFSRLTLSSNSENSEERTGSSRGALETQNSGILAPMPERAASSLSHHNRFSKIFNVDDDFPDLPDTLTVFDASGRSFTPDGSVDESQNHAKALGKRKSFHFPRPPMPKRRLKGANSLPTIPQRSNGTNAFGNGTHTDAVEFQPSPEGDDSSTGSDMAKVIELEPKVVYPTEHDEILGEVRGLDDQVALEASVDTYELDIPDCLNAPVIETDGDVDISPNVRIKKTLPALPNAEGNSSLEDIIAFETTGSLPGPDARPSASSPRVQTDNHEGWPPAGNRESSNDESMLGANGLQKFKVKLRSGRESALSPPGSRPWNLDESYPWMEFPQPMESPPPSSFNTQDEKREDSNPGLGAKVKRRFSSSRNTSKIITKRASATSDISCLGSSDRATRELAESPNPPVLPEISEVLGSPINPVNSSRTASFRASQISGPYPISSVPPSFMEQRLASPTPPLNTFNDVRSFFSDGSSQVLHRGSLRKRLSNLKGKRPAPKTLFTHEGSGNERPVISTAHVGRKRANTVMGNEGTVGMTNFEYSRRKMIERLRGWWQRSQAHFRIFETKKASDGRGVPQVV